MIYKVGDGYTLQGSAWLFTGHDLAILDKPMPDYDLQGRTWLYLKKQGLSMIYKAGPSYT